MTQADYTKTCKNLGHVLITGGAGFVGRNFVKTLLDRGHRVRSFDLAKSPLQHDNLQFVEGNICDKNLVEEVVQGIDTVFHIAAIIDLMGGAAVTEECRQRSYAINVEGSKTLLRAAQAAGV